MSDGGRPPIRRVGRRRVVSGDPLPSGEAGTGSGRTADSSREQTRDDTDAGWGESGVAPSRGKREGSGDREDDARARWLRAERPPHWG